MQKIQEMGNTHTETCIREDRKIQDQVEIYDETVIIEMAYNWGLKWRHKIDKENIKRGSEKIHQMEIWQHWNVKKKKKKASNEEFVFYLFKIYYIFIFG